MAAQVSFSTTVICEKGVLAELFLKAKLNLKSKIKHHKV